MALKYKPYIAIIIGAALLIIIIVLAKILDLGLDAMFTMTAFFFIGGFLLGKKDSNYNIIKGVLLFTPFLFIFGLLAMVNMSIIILFIVAAAIFNTYSGLYIRSRWLTSSFFKNISYLSIWVAIFTIISLLGYPRLIENNLTHKENKVVPEFKLQMLDGNLVTSFELKEKVVILDFWATWCGPCIKQFPEMQKLYEKYKDNPNVSFIAVNTGWRKDSIEKVQTFVETNPYSFPVAYDSAAIVTEQMGVRSVPHIILLDKQGKIRIEHKGSWGKSGYFISNMSKHIEKLLKED